MFNLLNQEFTFDVDVSNLPCGLNGALYFVSMEADGGMGGTNKCGAKYGTGYCDAQCPHDMKWINGEANCQDWKPSDNDVNSGKGDIFCDIGLLPKLTSRNLPIFCPLIQVHDMLNPAQTLGFCY